MLLSRILHYVLVACVKDVTAFAYTKVLEPLTGQEVRVARAEHLVDGLNQFFLYEIECFFLGFRQEGTL